MNITHFTIQILIVFTPGFFSYLIIQKFTNVGKYTIAEKILYIFIWSVIDYTVYYYLLFPILNYFNPKIKFHFEEIISNPDAQISLFETVLVSGTGLFLAITFAWFLNKKFHYSFAKKLGITSSIGYSHVWTKLMARIQSEGANQWIKVLDEKNECLYKGKLKNFTMYGPERLELYLIDVSIIPRSNGKIEEVPGLYYSSSWEDMQIRFYFSED